MRSYLACFWFPLQLLRLSMWENRFAAVRSAFTTRRWLRATCSTLAPIWFSHRHRRFHDQWFTESRWITVPPLPGTENWTEIQIVSGSSLDIFDLAFASSVHRSLFHFVCSSLTASRNRPWPTFLQHFATREIALLWDPEKPYGSFLFVRWKQAAHVEI